MLRFCIEKIRRTLSVTKVIPIAFVAAVIVGPQTVMAAEQVWAFNGEVLGTPTCPLVAPFFAGQVVQVQARLDVPQSDGPVPSDPNPFIGAYDFVEMSMTLEGVPEIGTTNNGIAGVLVLNDIGGEDVIRVGDQATFSFSTLLADLRLNSGAEGTFLSTALANDDLPAAATVFSLVPSAWESVINVIGTFDCAVVQFSAFGLAGESLSVPVGPTSITTNPDGSVTWHFTTQSITFPPGIWIDPPIASGFTYTMTNSALFTAISDFPPGFASDFEVVVGGASLGTFGPEESVDFTSFPGGGVSEFIVSGIDPGADTGSVFAFPLQIAFDSPSATFTMTSILAPDVPSMNGLAAVLVAAVLILVARKSLQRATC